MIGWHGSGGELKVEEKLMTDKSNFTPDEWKLILESVMMACLLYTSDAADD